MKRERSILPVKPMRRIRRPHRGLRAGWWKIPLAVLLTVAIMVSGGCLVLGSNGLALVEGYLLARYAFVETDADLDGATDQALNALVTGLGDRWSFYRDEESYQQLIERRANNYVGIGVTVTYEREEGLLVQTVIGDGPAEKAGIVPGDVIVAVNGVSLAGEGQEKGTELIAGEVGTTVEITLLGADGTQRTVKCTRATVHSPSAAGTMLEDNIGYIKLDNFYSGSAESFAQTVNLLIEDGAESLIIDLRSNPGGYVAQLTEMLDYLLPQGAVFRQHSRWWFETVSKSDEHCIPLPFVTIVNEHTYSAAELMAAELREFCGAPVVGVQTSGKGYSQLTFALSNGGAMGLSTATYCTGEGVSLIGQGIIPDVEMELDLTATEDTQLQAAINLLK